MLSGLLSFGVSLMPQVRPENAWGFSSSGAALLCSWAFHAEVSTSPLSSPFIFLLSVSSYQVTPACQEMLHLALTLPLQLVGVFLGSGIGQE